MFFQKKGKLRKEYDDKLIVLLEKVKNEWLRQKRMVEQSVEPSQDVLCSLKIAEAKYFFLLKEAKTSSCKDGAMVKGSAEKAEPFYFICLERSINVFCEERVAESR